MKHHIQLIRPDKREIPERTGCPEKKRAAGFGNAARAESRTENRDSKGKKIEGHRFVQYG